VSTSTATLQSADIRLEDPNLQALGACLPPTLRRLQFVSLRSIDFPFGRVTNLPYMKAMLDNIPSKTRQNITSVGLTLDLTQMDSIPEELDMGFLALRQTARDLRDKEKWGTLRVVDLEVSGLDTRVDLSWKGVLGFIRRVVEVSEDGVEGELVKVNLTVRNAP